MRRGCYTVDLVYKVIFAYSSHTLSQHWNSVVILAIERPEIYFMIMYYEWELNYHYAILISHYTLGTQSQLYVYIHHTQYNSYKKQSSISAALLFPAANRRTISNTTISISNASRKYIETLY